MVLFYHQVRDYASLYNGDILDNHKFDLKDSKGNTHKYVMPYHSATQGSEIVFVLLAAASGPLGLVLGELAKSGSISDIMDSNSSEALSNIDFSKVGSEVKQFLLANDSVALVKDILSKTIRDGKLLRDETIFDMAYCANYAELLKAVFEVIRANGFFPLLDIF